MKFFSDHGLQKDNLAKSGLNIATDPFVNSEEFRNYETYRQINIKVSDAIRGRGILTDDFLSRYLSLNPDFWKGYFLAGKYYFYKKEFSKAKTEFEMALTKEITTIPDKKNVEKYLHKTLKKLK